MSSPRPEAPHRRPLRAAWLALAATVALLVCTASASAMSLVPPKPDVLLGVSDQGLPRRMRTMAEGFLGRMVAYEEALGGGEIAGLVAALRRNVYGTVEVDEQRIAKLTAYVRSQVTALDRQAEADLLAGRVTFKAPPQG